MADEIIKKQQNEVLQAVSKVVNSLPLDNVVTEYNSKTGTASVRGNINNIQYTTTIKRVESGYVRTDSVLAIKQGKEVLKEQIIALKNQGFTQARIAQMLNISQPTVSNYLKKE